MWDVAVYDTNLSRRIQVGLGVCVVVLDWWYDRASRRFKWLPLECRGYWRRTAQP